MSAACVRAVINGRVQGVGYRAWAASTARKLGLTGWVRNRVDGTVEALFCGPEAEVQAMLAACRKGPMLARVDEMKFENSQELVPAGQFMTRETV